MSRLTSKRGAMGPPSRPPSRRPPRPPSRPPSRPPVRPPPPPTSRPQKRIQRLIPNVRYCINTGYLFAPAPEDDILYTRYFILAYGAVPPREDFHDDYMNPVDPTSIICKCSICTPLNDIFPVTRKTIAAYAHEVPPTPVEESNEEWLDPRPAPSVSWSTRSTNSEFFIRWSTVYEDVAAASSYEIYGYRDLTRNNYNHPWKLLSTVKHRNFRLKNFQHGGLYHYIVRSIDEYGRHSPFSKAVSLFLPVT